MKNVNKLAGEFFTAAISDAGVTVAAICKKVGVAHPTMSRVLKGESEMTLERMFGLSAALEVDANDVLEYIVENQPVRGGKKTTVASKVTSKPAKVVAKVAAKPAKRAAREEVVETPKRRGRPAKVETPVAKKRGRPAKVAEPIAVKKTAAKPVKIAARVTVKAGAIKKANGAKVAGKRSARIM